MLKVQLFGKGKVSYNRQPLAGFPGKQCHRLLCYLLLNKERPHPRERLAAVFWAEYPTATSRTYLRTCLWRLRQALLEAGAPAGEYLCCADDCVTFQGSDPYWLDVEVFEDALAPSRDIPGDRLDPHQARALVEADCLYAGELLDGIYDDWCLYDRERLRLAHTSLLFKLMAYCEVTGAYGRGLDYAQRILAQDPTREKVHRQVMRLHWLLGNTAEALAQYRLCTQILHEEFDVAPTAKTSALYKQMLHNQFDPSLPSVRRRNGRPQRPERGRPHGPSDEQLLDRLRHLEAVTAEAGTELREMRRLVEMALVGRT